MTLRLDVETLGEMLAYAGGIVALTAAGIQLIVRGELSRTTLVVFFAVVAVALLAFGWIGGDAEDERRRRLRGVFWVLALASVVELATVVVVLIAKVTGRGAAIWPTLVGALVALGLWLVFRGALQQIGLWVLTTGLLIAITFPTGSASASTGGMVTFSPPDFTGMALALFLLGLAWIALGAFGILTPRRTACVLGAILVAFAPYVLSFNHGNAGVVTVGIVGLLLIPLGEIIGERAVAGLGIAALLVGGGSATQALVGISTSSAWIALILGLAAIMVAMVLLRMRSPAVPPPSAGAAAGPLMTPPPENPPPTSGFEPPGGPSV